MKNPAFAGNGYVGNTVSASGDRLPAQEQVFYNFKTKVNDLSFQTISRLRIYYKYKIDIFTKEGEYIASIGASGFSDYPHYIQERGQEYADNRRRLYKIRHQKDRSKIGSRGWFSDQIFW